MNIKVKKLHPDAVLPKRAHSSDAGYDLTAIDDGVPSKDGKYIEYNTGIAIELPDGYHSLLHPRSSISKYDLVLANSIGLIDNSYRGALMCRFKIIPPVRIQSITVGDNRKIMAYTEGVFSYSEQERASWIPTFYKKGDRIAQLVIEKTEWNFEVLEVEELSDTARGSGGFGSTPDRK